MRRECYFEVESIKRKAAEELEDFRTRELSKAKADFQREAFENLKKHYSL